MSADLTLIDVFGRLRKECRAAGGQKAWAEAHGVSPQYVNDVLHARREPGESILRALGLRRVVTYRVGKSVETSSAT